MATLNLTSIILPASVVLSVTVVIKVLAKFCPHDLCFTKYLCTRKNAKNNSEHSNKDVDGDTVYVNRLLTSSK